MTQFLFFLLMLCVYPAYADTEKISIIGTGYVGLVTGCALANLEHNVTCVDIDTQKIEALKKSISPIYEPGLEKLLFHGLSQGNLSFSSDITNHISNSDIIIVCVGTGVEQTDLSAFFTCIDTIAKHMRNHTLICIKSTIPPGTAQKTKKLLHAHKKSDCTFDLVLNPEFLREGNACQDFFSCNPIVLGYESDYAKNIMKKIYAPLIQEGTPVIETNFQTSEIFKYAWNNFSALRICFTNELALLCNNLNADFEIIIKALHLSSELLSNLSLKPGPGIGGSCLIKDNLGLVEYIKQLKLELPLINNILTSNNYIRQRLIKQIEKLLDNYPKNTIKKLSILGLSFKAHTDDIRNSAALPILNCFIKKDLLITVYDPQAMPHMQSIFPTITYVETLIDAIKDADVILILTEWPEFAKLTPEQINTHAPNAKIIDTRQLLYLCNNHKDIIDIYYPK